MNDSINPYQPPELGVEDVSLDKADIVPTRKWLRFANLIIDYIGYSILSSLIGLAILLGWGEEATWIFAQSLPNLLFSFTVMLSYYISMEALFGRTPGKFITATRVVNEEGNPPSFAQVIGRSFCRFIPFEAFTFLSDEGRGWHDSFANTYVIKCR